jgi:hypothetical protein
MSKEECQLVDDKECDQCVDLKTPDCGRSYRSKRINETPFGKEPRDEYPLV